MDEDLVESKKLQEKLQGNLDNLNDTLDLNKDEVRIAFDVVAKVSSNSTES